MSHPWMPLYVADYLAGTSHLNTIEHGAYLLLIMHYWTKGKLPSDEESIRRITRLTARQWARHKDVLRSFFGNEWRHHRVDIELAKAIEKSSVNSANAKRRHNERNAKQERSDTQSPSQVKKDKNTPDGVSSKYAFESGLIKLNQKDFDRWKANFSHIELGAELLSLSAWANEQGKNWFHAIQGALAKRNREVKARKDALADQGGFKWNGGIEGVI